VLPGAFSSQKIFWQERCPDLPLPSENSEESGGAPTFGQLNINKIKIICQEKSLK